MNENDIITARDIITSTVAVQNVDGTLEVHRLGCRDLASKRSQGRVDSEWTVDVPLGWSITKAVGVDIADSGFASDEGLTGEEYFDKYGWDIHCLPCSSKATV